MADIGAQHGLVGDSYGTDLPETVIPENDLVREKNMAKFSKTKEFQTLKDHLEQRIGFYQTQLPDGRPLTDLDLAERANQWLIANIVIGEFKAVIQAYEQAEEVVKESQDAFRR